MFSRVAGVRIGYHEVGLGSPVVLLHGWGGDSRSFAPVQQALASDFRVLAIDFPGFGRSAAPPETWGVGDYADNLRRWLEEQGIDRVSLVGHSFGGRVAIVTAARWPTLVERLGLVDSAGILPRRTVGYHFKVRTSKIARRVLASPALARARPALERRLYDALGASDYAKAGPLRPTFVRVVNEDLRPLLPQITAPTLLIWGDKDDATPLEDGKLMAREIPGARLTIYPGAGHFAYLDRADQFADDVRTFLSS